MLKQLLIVGLGGGVGSIFRYLTSALTARFYGGGFPVATLFANLAGCFLIGVFAGLLAQHIPVNGSLRLLLITGFCGGYTTFSAFSLENLNLFQQNLPAAIVYIALSVAGGIAAVWAGMALAGAAR
ncbi:MAG: fluoride efflux transporter CrcB [Prevotella sp.]|jgi:CrcB protein|nr:fluoride efflux transporter CrcB [Prevotella sp.]